MNGMNTITGMAGGASDGMAGRVMGGMAGIPNGLYYSSIVVVMLVSIAVLEIQNRRVRPIGPPLRFELTRFWVVRAAFRSRGVQVAVQSFVAVLFLLVLAAGFYGYQHPSRNIAPTLTWNIWWVGLIFLILFLGKAWCYMCPWDAMTSWLRRLSFRGGKPDRFNLGWKWPRSLRNIYPATILFIGLTWLELGYQVTISPIATATLGLLMFGLVFIPGLLFERKSFCRYGCLIGRVSGLYAMFSPIEVRRRDPSVCRRCQTADCYNGNEKGYPCPTGQFLRTMTTNTYCTMCAECARSCPHQNVALNARPFASDLIDTPKPRKDEAYLALILFSLTAFHGLTMTPSWKDFVRAIRETLSVGDLIAFSVGMAFCLAVPMALYALGVTLGWKLAAKEGVRLRDLMIRFSYGLIPIALFYHIAHNVEHFVAESQKALVLVSDPFGWGWNLFGTAGMDARPFFSLSTVWALQVGLIIVGHVFGIYVTHHQADRVFGRWRGAFRGQIPITLLMVIFSVLSLWLVKQPMEMRTAM